MATLFISDLHLSSERPGINALFHQFLATKARNAEALYILGDLFEAWLGDDLVLPEYQPSIEAMHDLVDAGIEAPALTKRVMALGQFLAACWHVAIASPSNSDQGSASAWW